MQQPRQECEKWDLNSQFNKSWPKLETQNFNIKKNFRQLSTFKEEWLEAQLHLSPSFPMKK